MPDQHRRDPSVVVQSGEMVAAQFGNRPATGEREAFVIRARREYSSKPTSPGRQAAGQGLRTYVRSPFPPNGRTPKSHPTVAERVETGQPGRVVDFSGVQSATGHRVRPSHPAIKTEWPGEAGRGGRDRIRRRFRQMVRGALPVCRREPPLTVSTFPVAPGPQSSAQTAAGYRWATATCHPRGSREELNKGSSAGWPV